MRILKKFVKDKFPQLVFLIETKCNKHKMEYIRRSLQFDNYFTVESIGANGGLALLWNQDVSLQILSFTRWHIHAIIQTGEFPYCYVFGFYDQPYGSKRESSWDLLQLIKPTTNSHWLCFGDFNKITNMREKMSRVQTFKTNGELSRGFRMLWD